MLDTIRVGTPRDEMEVAWLLSDPKPKQTRFIRRLERQGYHTICDWPTHENYVDVSSISRVNCELGYDFFSSTKELSRACTCAFGTNRWWATTWKFDMWSAVAVKTSAICVKRYSYNWRAKPEGGPKPTQTGYFYGHRTIALPTFKWFDTFHDVQKNDA